MTDALVVLITAPSADSAEKIARELVGQKLAACVNIIGPIRSIYRWHDGICDEAETLLVVKTTASRYPALEAAILVIHPYDTPEVLALPIEAGAKAYLQWLTGAVIPSEP